VRALFLLASVALAAQSGAASAQRLPSGLDPKTCSYNACIRECIRTRMPNCDNACQRCPAR